MSFYFCILASDDSRRGDGTFVTTLHNRCTVPGSGTFLLLDPRGCWDLNLNGPTRKPICYHLCRRDMLHQAGLVLGNVQGTIGRRCIWLPNYCHCRQVYKGKQINLETKPRLWSLIELLILGHQRPNGAGETLRRCGNPAEDIYSHGKCSPFDRT